MKGQQDLARNFPRLLPFSPFNFHKEDMFMANGIPNLCMTEMAFLLELHSCKPGDFPGVPDSWPDSGKDYNVFFGKVLVVMINREFAFIAIGWRMLRLRWVLVVLLPELMFIDVPHHTSSVTLNLSRTIFQLHLCHNCKKLQH